MEDIVYLVVRFGCAGAAVGAGLGFVVIIIDYLYTSILSMMKGGV